jgi:hypothetical protein
MSKILSRESKLSYIKDLWRREDSFKGVNLSDIQINKGLYFFFNRGYLKQFLNFIYGLYDLMILLIRLNQISKINGRKVKLLFIARNFCVDIQGKKKIRIASDLFDQSTIFINSSKEHKLSRLDDVKVYNIGLFVKLISDIVKWKGDLVERQFFAYQLVNDLILRYDVFESINFFWFYDLNSLSIIFSQYRDRHKLVEIQHGSIINYPPYELPAPVKVADLFYVRNEATINYLKDHLCSGYNCAYKFIPYPSVHKARVSGLNILYASTIEFKGFHPIFKEFVKNYGKFYPNTILNVTIRLHPRERGKENLFLPDLKEFCGNYRFDNSDNWLLYNAIEGLIVISPWSSTLEEAYDNGYTSITIDPVGKKRFDYFLKSRRFHYSDNLIGFFENSNMN